MPPAYILGLNSAYHESAACLLRDGELVAAVEEERFNRIKHAKHARVDNPQDLPWQAIQYCLTTAGITLAEVDHVGYSLDPVERRQNQYFVDDVTPGSWGDTVGEGVFYDNLTLIPGQLEQKGFAGRFHWLRHHLCHAASAFYPAPFDPAAVLTVDGIGETGSTLLALGEGHRITTLREISYPASLGFLWEKLSLFLGFTEYDAYKVMGLAAYGDPATFRSHFEQLVRLCPDGTFELDADTLKFRVEAYETLSALFGLSHRESSQPLTPTHHDIAAALQEATTAVVLHLAQYLYQKTGQNNLCLAGGVALNCVTNRQLLEEGPFEQLYASPAAHDAGTAHGAALLVWHHHLAQEQREPLAHPYLGPVFSEVLIEQVLQEGGLRYDRVDNIEAVVSRLLDEGYIVGWFQGAMEWGPRALGNRSLLADPRRADIRDIMNLKVKHREPFRPFAPSVLIEEVAEWFEIQRSTPATDFMLLAYPVKPDRRQQVPAIVHVDGTSRVQTVRAETNPRFHRLISEFFELTGVPMLLNTSFNDSEPLVCTPEDAINTFMKTGIDYLVMGDCLVAKNTRSDSAALNHHQPIS